MDTVEMIKTASAVLGLVIQLGTVIGLIYALLKFTTKPTEDLEGRVGKLELWANKTDARLHQGVEHFAANDEGQRVTQAALLAIIDALINMDGINNDSKRELLKQKNALYIYLTKGKAADV